MKIAIVGTGAMGSVYAALFAAADCATLDKAVNARYDALRQEVKGLEARPGAAQALVFE